MQSVQKAGVVTDLMGAWNCLAATTDSADSDYHPNLLYCVL